MNPEKSHSSEKIDLPPISILVAARNEERTIARCLGSLLDQDYPSEKLEILVGNDQSTDQTKKVVESFKEKGIQIKLFDISEETGLAKGKANVLAQLAQKAKSEYLLITDADMQLPASWAKGLVLHAIRQKSDLTTGFTLVEGKDWFSQLQCAEWAMALFLIKRNADLGNPLTAMGNNMLVSRAAYEQVGGYESIPFSITEDFALFKAIRDRGGICTHVMESGITGITLPAKTWKQLFMQRKRWMAGAMQLPFFYRMGYIVQMAYLPVLLGVFMYNWKTGIAFVAVRYLLFLFGFFSIFFRLKKKLPWKGVLLFDVYQWFAPIIHIANYFFGKKIEWKGRFYGNSQK